jgi:hypothetical protein
MEANIAIQLLNSTSASAETYPRAVFINTDQPQVLLYKTHHEGTLVSVQAKSGGQSGTIGDTNDQQGALKTSIGTQDSLTTGPVPGARAV